MPGDRRAALRTRRTRQAIMAALDPAVRSSEERDTLRAGIVAEFEADLDAALAELSEGRSIITMWEFHHLDDQDQFIGSRPLRRGAQAATWRKAVLARDGHACTRCGSTEHLHAHHVLEWATHPAERFSVDNGLTLCRSCHRDVHRG